LDRRWWHWVTAYSSSGLCPLVAQSKLDIDAFSNYGPVPVRLRMCGLVGSLATLTAMLALSAEPPAVGVNFTATVHDECAAAVAPQVPPATAKSLAFAPLKLSLDGSEDPDRLVTVAFNVLEVVFRVPYAIVAGATVAGIVGPVLVATM
jgi:hypothetical protein